MRLQALSRPALMAIIIFAASVVWAAHKPPKTRPATDYANVQIEQNVAIAAEPYLSRSQQKIFAIPYRKFGFAPIWLTITNQNDRPISIADARVYLLSANQDPIEAATPDDVERAIPLRDKEGSQIPIGPFKMHTHAQDSDWRVEQDFNRFEYNALTVPAHGTIAGFLWYDISGLAAEAGKAPLAGAKLMVTDVRNPDGKLMFYFAIPLGANPQSR